MSKGLTIVISAPSGGGKGTILKELFARNDKLRFSISATTRKPRPGEVHGEQYYFLETEEFRKMIDEGLMLEHAVFCDNYYGTPKAPVEETTANGFDVVLEIEVQGGAQVKKLAPDSVSIFIVPPSLEILEKRLRGRGTETDEVVKQRLETAKKELQVINKYDYVVINDELEDAVNEIQAIIIAEKLKISRNKDILERII